MSSAGDELIDAAASLYQPISPFPFHFARGKLRHDPVFLAVLKSGLIKNGMTVLDLLREVTAEAAVVELAPRPEPAIKLAA